ncbi:sigma-70 family RNA polymerase sigma factor [Sphingobacterium sp.]|uniref:RNA polymerase sigma factor n=1 Tax=Sphingobacterium sp. TaxID=341027 RepID=UPI0031DDD384
MNYAAYSDAQIFELVCNGDERALQIIISRFWQQLFKTAFHAFPDAEVCQELVQNVFIKIWESRAKITLKYSVHTYLFSCIRYEVFHEIKRTTKQNKLKNNDFKSIDSFDPLLKMEYTELLDYVEQLINNLPDKCKHVFYLSRIEQLKDKEIAQQLNISPKTVENQISIALKKLKQEMAKRDLLFFIFL